MKKRTRQGGGDDTHGSKALRTFLKDYERLAIQDACAQGRVDPTNLKVWANRSGVWRPVDLPAFWGRKSEQSLCRELIMRTFGLTGAQYEAMRDGFDDVESTDAIGVYRQKKDRNQYAIVLRLPANAPDNKWLYTGAAGTGGVVLGALGKWAADQRKPVPGTEPAKKKESKKEETPESTKKDKWIEACTNFVLLSGKLRQQFPSPQLYFQNSFENGELAELPKKIFDFNTFDLFISDLKNRDAQDTGRYQDRANAVQTGINRVTAAESYALAERPLRSGALQSKFEIFTSTAVRRWSNLPEIKKTAEQIIQAKETIEQNKGWIDSIQ
jgi:hypothetical protein